MNTYERKSPFYLLTVLVLCPQLHVDDFMPSFLIQSRLRRRSERVVAPSRASASSSTASTTPALTGAAEGSAPSSPAPSSTATGGGEGDMEDERALKKSLLVLWNDIDQHRFANNFHKPPANSDDVLK